MKKQILSLKLLLAISFSISTMNVSAAPIAKIKKISGIVMINNGESYVPARTGMRLRTGDQLLTLESGRVLIEQKDICQTLVPANTLLKVTSTDKCLADVAVVEKMGTRVAAALGSFGAESSDEPVKKIETRSNSGALGSFEKDVPVADEAAALPEESSLLALNAKLVIPTALTGAVLFSTLAGGGGKSGSDNNTPLSAQ